jgi:predicted AAA+ superfamily ATPase
MYHRICNPLLSNSFFLLGARGTGKSRLIGELLREKRLVTVDLLVPELERRLRRRPSMLVSMIKAEKEVEWVFIDEIQKIPELLDIVHSQIEGSRIKFALSGSSARKLKRGAANLLAGRAYSYNLFPLTSVELGQDFDLSRTLRWGSLPKIMSIESDEERAIFLESYAQSYLREEVLAEQLIRKIAPFQAFLEVAAQMNGEILNFAKIGREIGSDSKVVRSYFDLLVDTMIGFYLGGFATSARKRVSLAPKFYFFDLGVKRALDFSLGESVSESTYGYGRLFETLVLQELYRLNSYYRKSYEFSYLRTQSGVEVDLVLRLGQRELILVEIKSTDAVRGDHLRSLLSLGAEIPATRRYCLSNDPYPRTENGVRIVPWQMGIEEIMGQ